MERAIVQVARIRAMDASIGDVVSRDPNSDGGWFQLRKLDDLHDGRVNLSDGGVTNSFSTWPLDLVGLQIIKSVPIEAQPELPVMRAAGAELDDAGDDSTSTDEHLEQLTRP